MMNTTPKVMIGIGETGALFTLRGTFEGFDVHGQPCIRTYHIKNLSQDLTEAEEKAQKYANDNGVMFYNVNRDCLDRDMREIKRAGADEIAARTARMEATRKETEAYLINNREAKLNATLAGYMTFGGVDVIGLHVSNISKSYATWIVKNQSNFDVYSCQWIMAEIIKEQYADMILPDYTDTYIGVIGKRMTREVVIRNVVEFVRQSFNGGYENAYIIQMYDTETGGMLVCFTGSGYDVSKRIGETLKIAMTPKKHDIYKDAKQTVVQRIAIKN